MISFTLDELTTPLTRAEIEQAIYDTIEASGTSTSAWQPGAVTRAMIRGCAICLAAFSALIAVIASGGFLVLARGSWLTLVAFHVFGVSRRAATYAAGSLDLVNSGAGVFSPQPYEVIAVNSSTGKKYWNTESFSLGIGGSVSVAFAAIESGVDSTAAIAAIDTFETSGFDDVSVTNAAALVGLDEMKDPELRALCTATRDAVSPNGPKRAYEKFAFDAVRSSGTAIGVTRARSIADGNGTVTSYFATASGAITGDEDDELTDLGAIAKNIRENVEPLAVTHVSVSASTVTVNVTYELWCWSDVDVTGSPAGSTKQDRIKAQILLDLATYLAGIPIGGVDADANNTVFAETIQGEIQRAYPEIYRVVLTSPASDTVLTTGQAPVIGTVSGVVNLVTRQS